MLLQLLDREVTTLTGSGHPRIEARLGHLGGFDLTTSTCRVLGTTQVTMAFDGAPESEIRLTAADLAETDAAGLVIRLENRLTGLESLKTRTVAEIDRLRIEAARAREDIEKPFPQSGQLAEARVRVRVRRIEEQLKEAAAAQSRMTITGRSWLPPAYGMRRAGLHRLVTPTASAVPGRPRPAMERPGCNLLSTVQSQAAAKGPAGPAAISRSKR